MTLRTDIASKKPRRNYNTNVHVRESFENRSKGNTRVRIFSFSDRSSHRRCRRDSIRDIFLLHRYRTNFDSIQRFRFTYRSLLQRYRYLQATFISISSFVAGQGYFWSILPARFRGTRDNVSGYIPGRYQPACPWQRVSLYACYKTGTKLAKLSDNSCRNCGEKKSLNSRKNKKEEGMANPFSTISPSFVLIGMYRCAQIELSLRIVLIQESRNE